MNMYIDEHKKKAEMSIGEILSSIRQVIRQHEESSKENEDILELTEIVQEKRDYTKAANYKHTSGAEKTLESLLIETLKPLLIQWMDNNLPFLIKQILEKEISKFIPNKK